VPGHVKLTFTLDMPRELAERLSARAIRDGVNLEAVMIRMLVGRTSATTLVTETTTCRRHQPSVLARHTTSGSRQAAAVSTNS